MAKPDIQQESEDHNGDISINDAGVALVNAQDVEEQILALGVRVVNHGITVQNVRFQEISQWLFVLIMTALITTMIDPVVHLCSVALALVANVEGRISNSGHSSHLRSDIVQPENELATSEICTSASPAIQTIQMDSLSQTVDRAEVATVDFGGSYDGGHASSVEPGGIVVSLFDSQLPNELYEISALTDLKMDRNVLETSTHSNPTNRKVDLRIQKMNATDQRDDPRAQETELTVQRDDSRVEEIELTDPRDDARVEETELKDQKDDTHVRETELTDQRDDTGCLEREHGVFIAISNVSPVEPSDGQEVPSGTIEDRPALCDGYDLKRD